MTAIESNTTSEIANWPVTRETHTAEHFAAAIDNACGLGRGRNNALVAINHSMITDGVPVGHWLWERLNDAYNW